jgi:hypothetical protein
MKHIVPFFLLWMVFFLSLYGSTRSDVTLLESSEKIKFLSQKLAREYIFLYRFPHKKEAIPQMQKDLLSFEESLRHIALATKKPKVKRLLEFFSYEKESLREHIATEPTSKGAMSFLDNSEAITEGAENIAHLVGYDFSFEEKMLMHSKKISYLLEKIFKYYTVLSSSLDKTNSEEKMRQAIVEMERELNLLKSYRYPEAIKQVKSNLFESWEVAKYYYLSSRGEKVPNIVNIAHQDMQTLVGIISIYHSKNQ